MRIIIESVEGKVLKVIHAKEIGDLDKSKPRADLMAAIDDAWLRDGAPVHGRRQHEPEAPHP